MVGTVKMTPEHGVAISTTGDEHRMDLLEASASAWWMALAQISMPTCVWVIVDGDEDTVARVYKRVAGFARVARVGQPDVGWNDQRPLGMREGRLGVAANKNTGLEILMGAGVEHLFLCDDDTWPLSLPALAQHTAIAHEVPHSMVAWGSNRRPVVDITRRWASWTWPRGVMMYTHRDVIETVGGMDERFGPGGHEHVEWSRRIFQHGITPAMYCSPSTYAGARGMGARTFWHCEDAQQVGEPLGNARLRRKNLTSVRRRDGDWAKIEAIMAERDQDTSYVPYTAQDNLRLPATLLP